MISKSSKNSSSIISLTESLRRGDVLTPACPSREILSHLTNRWGVLVLISLLSGTMRFSELRRRIGGVSEKMLAQTLQQLEKDGIITRYSYEIVPPHVEYTLTPLGVEVAIIIKNLTNWIETNYHQLIKK